MPNGLGNLGLGYSIDGGGYGGNYGKPKGYRLSLSLSLSLCLSCVRKAVNMLF